MKKNKKIKLKLDKEVISSLSNDEMHSIQGGVSMYGVCNSANLSNCGCDSEDNNTCPQSGKWPCVYTNDCATRVGCNTYAGCNNNSADCGEISISEGPPDQSESLDGQFCATDGFGGCESIIVACEAI